MLNKLCAFSYSGALLKFSLSCILCAASATAAVSTGPAPANANQFAYAADQGGNTVSGYEINAATGKLTPLAGSPFFTGNGGSTAVAANPAGTFLYVTKPYGNNVTGFSINRATGQLTPLSGSPFAAGAGPSSMAIDPSGQFAYVTNFSDDTVSAYLLNSTTGYLKPVSGSPFKTGTWPTHVTVDPAGKFVYVSNLASSNVSGFSINASTGALTPIAGSPFPAGTWPISVAVDPNDRFVYVANQSSDNISGYLLNGATGALTALGTSPFAVGASPYTVTVDPSGAYVYASGAGGVYSFSINQSLVSFGPGFPPLSLYGQLTPVIGSPFGGITSNDVAVDYTGTFAYSAQQSNDELSVYRLGAGSLGSISGGSFGSGPAPNSIVLVRPPSSALYSAVQLPNPNAVGFGSVRTFTPSGINNKGHVVGSLAYYPLPSDDFAYGFLYNGVNIIEAGQDRSSSAYGINDSDEVVGQSYFEPPFVLRPPPQAFLYNGTLTDIDNVQCRESTAVAINNSGLATGYFIPGTPGPISCTSPGNTQAFIYAGSGLVGLGSLAGSSGSSAGTGINNLGQIVGWSTTSTDNLTHLFLYSDGTMHDLGAPFGQSVSGALINNNGEIAGPGFLYSGGRFQAIPLAPLGLNDAGVMVGKATEPNGASDAVIYQSGQLTDLNSLVDPSTTFLTGAAGVNNSGQIVVSGLNGQIYVLTPRTPVP